MNLKMRTNDKNFFVNSNSSQEINHVSLPRSKIIAFEGMPGAGKTTILTALAEELENTCILLSELNLENDLFCKDLSNKEKEDTFLKLWVERSGILNTFKDPRLCFLIDRSYFSNLAYIYALDFVNGTHRYQSYQKTFNDNFTNICFELMFVFDISPEIGLKRRISRGDILPWPWSNIIFLNAMRKFYREELQKYFRGEIIYISTDIEIDIIKKNITNCILSLTHQKTYSYLQDEKHLEIIADFAKTHSLGEALTRVINVLGNPTIYYLKHSVQIDKGKPVIFNNEQLYKISQMYSPSILKS